MLLPLYQGMLSAQIGSMSVAYTDLCHGAYYI
jgi:hypothetical protein